MTDLGSIVQGLGALKQATEILKVLSDANTAYEKAELKLKIAELAEVLLTARVALLEAQTEIQELRNEVRRLSEKPLSPPIERHGLYFFKDGDRESGPFCARCFVADTRRMPLTKLPAVFADVAKYRCPQCDSTY